MRDKPNLINVVLAVLLLLLTVVLLSSCKTVERVYYTPVKWVDEKPKVRNYPWAVPGYKDNTMYYKQVKL